MKGFRLTSAMTSTEQCAQEAYNISSDDSDSDTKNKGPGGRKRIKREATQSTKYNSSDDALDRRAEMYQEYMRHIPVPCQHASVIPCTSWQGLGRSVKLLYGQPLHYLTNILLKQWDQMRFGSADENQPLDSIIHPSKAEALIWVTEEVHRLTTSHLHLAKLWALDPLYQAYIDPGVAQTPTPVAWL